MSSKCFISRDNLNWSLDESLKILWKLVYYTFFSNMALWQGQTSLAFIFICKSCSCHCVFSYLNPVCNPKKGLRLLLGLDVQSSDFPWVEYFPLNDEHWYSCTRTAALRIHLVWGWWVPLPVLPLCHRLCW